MQKISLKKTASNQAQAGKGDALAQVMAIKAKLTPKELSALMNASNEVMNKDAWGRNAILAAAADGDEVKLKEVLGWGLDPHEVGLDGQGALDLAATAGSLPCVKLLIKARVKPGMVHLQMGAFEWAAKTANVPVFKALLKAYPDLIKERSGNVCGVALSVNAKGIFDALLPHIDWHARCELSLQGKLNAWFKKELNGRPALTAATIMNKTDWLQEMIAAGANTEVPDWLGRSALEQCCVSGGLDTAKVLLKAKAYKGQAWLMSDSKGVYVRLKKEPKNKVGKYNVPNKGSIQLRLSGTPTKAICLALWYKNFDVAKLLMDHGEGPFEILDGQRLAMGFGGGVFDSSIYSWLEDNADFSKLNVLRADGTTLLSNSLTTSVFTVKWLLDQGADPRVKKCRG